jgi:diadenylate cyclase
MSENSDAIVLVVSEETGTISLAVNGKITRDYNSVTLKEELYLGLLQDSGKKKTFFTDLIDKFKKK